MGVMAGGVGGHVAVEVSNIVDTPLSGHPLMTIWGWAFGGTSLMSMLRKPLRKLSRKLLRKPSRKMREKTVRGARKMREKMYEKTVQKHSKTRRKIITLFSRIFAHPLQIFPAFFAAPYHTPDNPQIHNPVNILCGAYPPPALDIISYIWGHGAWYVVLPPPYVP